MTKLTRFTLAAGVALMPMIAMADSARTALDWAGRYEGVLPCASCEGIQTVILLGDDNTYQIVETYLGEKDGEFVEDGTFTWGKDGNTITLDDEDKRAYLVSEHQLIQLDADGKPGDDKYVLAQTIVPASYAEMPAAPTVDEATKNGAKFIGGGANLTVMPNTLVQSEMEATKDRHVAFDALMNLEFPTEAGHKSLTATFDINCTKNVYAMPTVAYFSEDDAKGKKIEEVTNNGDTWIDLPMDGERDTDVVTQAAQAFCH
ncbi:copper resistance protein NlpE [Paracoccus sp. p3-h83]|uniref:copper resistance protein NlpE n=1 Tax=Paracoccus sp. p3-h83 TaxID=3342805 RepID=UPI0035B8A382